MNPSKLNRRRLLTGIAIAPLMIAGTARTVAFAEPAPGPDFAELERRFNGRLGLSAINLGNGATLAHRGDERFAMCSTFKVYAAAAVLRLAESGQVALTDRIQIGEADMVPHAPVTSQHVGEALTLAELCEAALTQSDNPAANLLLRTIGGPPAIGEFARSVGDSETRLDRWEVALNSAIPGDPRDTTTPNALATGFRTLLAGDGLAPASRDQLESWMRATQTSDKRIRAGLPPGWTSADKTGGGDYATANDAGILFGPDGQRYIVTILTNNHPFGPADGVGRNELVAGATAAVVTAFSGPR